jgi:hypothetical protein
MLYELTDTTKRVIRVMYSNIEKPVVIEHAFAALTNLWFTGPYRCVWRLHHRTLAFRHGSLLRHFSSRLP